MSATTFPAGHRAELGDGAMRAAVFEGKDRIVLQEHAVPECGPTDAIVRVTMTTICGTDVHILRGEYPVEPGRIIGHEPVGVIEHLGSAVVGYEVGDRVLVGAITPCGSCFYCQSHSESQCAGHGGEWEMIGGWRLRQLDRRRAGGLLPRAVRPGQPGEDPRRHDRRAVPDARRHRVDRHLGRRDRQRPDRPDRRGLRAGPDRPVRDRRRAAEGRVADHRRRRDREPADAGPRDGRRRGHRLPSGGPGRRDQAPHRGARRRRRDRGARAAADVRVGARGDPSRRHRLEPRRVRRQARAAAASRSSTASATRTSSRRCVPAARSGCAS